ncbi:MAG: pentapeptide repeat-containing protein [Magnetococcales bacterium]|nr:pentapeptide repeat-containing protein [Magnetococcales bacterium]
MDQDNPQFKELKDRLDSVNEAIKLNREVHLLFVLVGIYLAILIGSTTHKQLLLESPVTLPLLNVALPIVQMYIWVPWAWLLLHINLLLLMYMLASQLDQLWQFDRDLLANQGAAYIKDKLYLFPFPQWISGVHASRAISWVLGGYVVLTTLILPVLLLILTQVRFLPYQNESITWSHRVVIVLDLLSLYLFWPRITHRFSWWEQRKLLKKLLFVFINAFILILVFGFFVIPHEMIETRFLSIDPHHPWLRRALKLNNEVLVKEPPAVEIVAAYVKSDYDQQNSPRKWDPKESEENAWLGHAQGLDLSGRNFRYADFTSSKFFRVRFYNDGNHKAADLRGSVFENATLVGAVFYRANLEGAQFRIARLQGAVFSEADMRGAILESARMMGALFVKTRLDGADFSFAQLQGAALSFLSARGTVFNNTDMQGVNLWGADLQHATFGGARLLGVNLSESWMDFADYVGVLPVKFNIDAWDKIKNNWNDFYYKILLSSDSTMDLSLVSDFNRSLQRIKDAVSGNYLVTFGRLYTARIFINQQSIEAMCSSAQSACPFVENMDYGRWKKEKIAICADPYLLLGMVRGILAHARKDKGQVLLSKLSCKDLGTIKDRLPRNIEKEYLDIDKNIIKSNFLNQ